MREGNCCESGFRRAAIADGTLRRGGSVTGPRVAALALLAFALAPRGLLAEAPVIEHEGAGCVVANRFPRIEARITPEENVARARVYFRAEGTPHWYFVDMAGEAGRFAAALPKPKPSLKRLEYYVEATDKVMGSSRSAEHTPAVVGSPAECRSGMALATALVQAVVKVGMIGPAGAPLSIPVGFASEGIVSASTGAAAGSAGGVSGKALAIGGAAAAGGAAAIAAAAGGGSSEPTAAPTPAPTPAPAAPAPAPPKAQVSFRFIAGSPGPGSSIQDPGGTYTVQLTVSIGVSCSQAVSNARLFVQHRRGGTACVTSYRDFSLGAGAELRVDVAGFVVQPQCRPVPLTTEDIRVSLYDMAGDTTTPLGVEILPVSYRFY